jgi:hypothetical protein
MNTIKRFFMISSAVLAGMSIPLRAETPDGIYRKAVLAETAERDLEQAVRLYELASEPEGPVRVKALFRWAKCLEIMEKKKEASAVYQRLLDSSPDAEMLEEVKFRLSRLEDSFRPAVSSEFFFRPTAAPSARRWRLMVEGGAAFAAPDRVFGMEDAVLGSAGFSRYHKTIWTSAALKISRPLWVGLEWGEFLPASHQRVSSERDPMASNIIFTTLNGRYRASYLGPMILMSKNKLNGGPWASFGFGIAFQRSDLHETVDSRFSIGSPRTVLFEDRASGGSSDFAFSGGMGYDWKVANRMSIGLGVRDLLVFFKEYHMSDENFSSRTRRHARQIIVPVLRSSITFGG